MKNNKYHIYLIVNPQGKKYVGSTSCLKNRMNQYKNLSHKHQRKIYESISKYGWENHSFQILATCDEDCRFYLEAYFGNLFNCIGDHGLNLYLPKVNDTWAYRSKETSALISESKKGHTPWNKGIEFMKGELNPMYGIKRTKEWKFNHSLMAAKLNKKGQDHYKSKLVLNLETGIFYDTCKEASNTHCVPYSTLKQRLRRKSSLNMMYV